MTPKTNLPLSLEERLNLLYEIDRLENLHFYSQLSKEGKAEIDKNGFPNFLPGSKPKIISRKRINVNECERINVKEGKEKHNERSTPKT